MPMDTKMDHRAIVNVQNSVEGRQSGLKAHLGFRVEGVKTLSFFLFWEGGVGGYPKATRSQ